jgi:hypothetical protein
VGAMIWSATMMDGCAMVARLRPQPKPWLRTPSATTFATIMAQPAQPRCNRDAMGLQPRATMAPSRPATMQLNPIETQTRLRPRARGNTLSPRPCASPLGASLTGRSQRLSIAPITQRR